MIPFVDHDEKRGQEMRLPNIGTTDTAVIGRLTKPDRSDFSPETAREILSLQFDDADKHQMNQLSLKAQEGMLTPEEQAEV